MNSKYNVCTKSVSFLIVLQLIFGGPVYPAAIEKDFQQDLLRPAISVEEKANSPVAVTVTHSSIVQDPSAAFLGSGALSSVKTPVVQAVQYGTAAVSTSPAMIVSINAEDSLKGANFKQTVYLFATSSGEGDVRDENNLKIGDYTTIPAAGGRSFLLLAAQRPDGVTPNMVHLFWTDSSGQMKQLTSSTLSTIMDYETNRTSLAAHWAALDRFLVDPLSLNQTEYTALQAFLRDETKAGDPAEPISSDAEAKSNFIPVYLTRLLDALEARPQYEFGAIQPLAGMSFNNETIRSDKKAVIVDRLEAVWDKLSINTRLTFLARLTNGNSQTMGKIANLTSSYLDQLLGISGQNEAKANALTWLLDPKAGSAFMIDGLLSNLVSFLAVNATIRDKIITQVLSHCVSNPFMYAGAKVSFVVDFIAKVLVPLGNASLNISLYGTTIRNYIAAVFAQSNLQATAVKAWGTIMSQLSNYISQEVISSGKVDAVASAVLASAVNPKDLVGLLDLLKGPLSAANRSAVETKLLGLDMSNWSMDDMAMLREQVSHGPLALSEANEKVFLNKVITYLQNHYSQRASGDPAFTGIYLYDIVLAKVIRLAREGGHFASLAPDFDPLLGLFNPKQASETATVYQARINRIQSLFRNYGIFLEDLNGTMVTGSLAAGKNAKDYIDLITAAAQGNIAKPNIVVLNAADPGTDGSGFNIGEDRIVGLPVSIDLLRSPASFSAVLFHELCHLKDFESRETGPELNNLIRYFFFENNSKPHTDIPKNYAWGSSAELFSGINDSIIAGGGLFLSNPTGELHRAIQEFNGFSMGSNPSQLNLMMYLFRTLKPEGIPAGNYVAIPWLDSVTGALGYSYYPASWQVGNTNNGIFILTVSDKTYRFAYQDGKVTEAGYFVSSNYDVNKNGLIEPMDVLIIINYLNSTGNVITPGSESLDVNRSGSIEPLDVLMLINVLNDNASIRDLRIGLPQGEGEAPPELNAEDVSVMIQEAFDAMDTRIGSARYKVQYDLNRDGIISRSEAFAVGNLGQMLSGSEQVLLAAKRIIGQKVYDTKGRLVQAAVYKGYPLVQLGTEYYSYAYNGNLSIKTLKNLQGRKIREEYYNIVTKKITNAYEYDPATGAINRYEYYNSTGRLYFVRYWDPVTRKWVTKSY
jgi:hypothetical protein